MAAEKISRLQLELTHLFEQQVEYFRKRNVGEPAAERREYEKRRERIRQLFAELSGLKKAA